MKKIGVLGAGTWGTALARMLSLGGNTVTVWSHNARSVAELDARRIHPRLEGMRIPREIIFTSELERACRGQDFVLFAVPSVHVRTTAAAARAFLSPETMIVDAAKGIEPETFCTMTEVIHAELSHIPALVGAPVVAFSGPTHAEEVARDLPSAVVAACAELSAAEAVQQTFSSDCMRVYTNTDVRGVELCGALKNIIALSAGIADGLGYGDNTRAALITRGLAEMIRLGKAEGCSEQTFCGLAGVGDLIVTATSVHSRNHRAGMLIGQGHSPASAIAQVGMVVEGVNALPAAVDLAARHGVEIPIIAAADAVVNRGAAPRETVNQLMGRSSKREF